MNKVEKALIHGLFVHLHHNIDKAIDFGQFKKLNEKVAKFWPTGSLAVGPDANDDAGVVKIPDAGETFVVGKMESHNSPAAITPYDSAATGAGGAMRDVVAMGGRPLFVLDFIGTVPLEQEILVGPCVYDDKCSCGKCEIMTSQERTNRMLTGVRDMCDTMDVFVAGGGFSTSFRDVVPAVVVSVFGKLVTDKPLTKPAKNVGDKIVLIGKTGNDGNDTLYRAGLVSDFRPAIALFAEERTTMNATLAAFKAAKINACSDLGAAGIGAAISESARYGGLGAKVDLTNVPTNSEITPEEILVSETQARMVLQIASSDVEKVIAAVEKEGGTAVEIGEITNDDFVKFTFNGENVATIPNHPSTEVLAEASAEA
jgi:phosphoribosylformylglycinamidine synthase